MNARKRQKSLDWILNVDTKINEQEKHRMKDDYKQQINDHYTAMLYLPSTNSVIAQQII